MVCLEHTYSNFLTLIDNRTYGPFWWRRNKMGTVISLLRSNTCDIHLDSLRYGLFNFIKHVKVTWT